MAARLIIQNISGVLCRKTKLITKRLPNKYVWSKCISRSYARGYESDGKTVGFILNKKGGSTLFVDDIYTDGFMTTDGTHLAGSVVIFPHSILSWHVLSAEDVNEDALILFKILEPKVDLLIFGYGNKEKYTPQVKKQFTEACKKLGLRFEALPTVQAVGLFNFMSEERRFVAAALIPPAEIDMLKLEKVKPSYIDDEDEIDAALKSGLDENINVKYLK